MPNVLLMSYSLGAGGTERQVALMAIGLKALGWGVHVAAFHPSGSRADELEAAGVPVHEIPVRSFHDRTLLTGVRALRRLVREHSIGLVHAFDYPSVVLAIPVARWLGVLAIASQRGERGFWPWGWQFWLRRADGLAHKVVVNSEWVRRDLIEHHGTNPDKIAVLYNGIDTAVFHPRGRARLPELAGAGCVIGTVSVLRPEKRIDTLIEAFAQLETERQGAKLLIAGGGPERPALEALAKRRGIAADTLFLGDVTDVAPVFRSIDIFVLGSTTEAFSNSLMEAMACGCAAAASDVGGNPEMISAGEDGLLFPPGDAPALAGRLRTLVRDSGLRCRFAANAGRKIEARFTQPAAANRFAHLYEELLGPPEPAED